MEKMDLRKSIMTIYLNRVPSIEAFFIMNFTPLKMSPPAGAGTSFILISGLEITLHVDRVSFPNSYQSNCAVIIQCGT